MLIPSSSRCLQRRDVVDGEESVVLLAEADPRPLQLLLDEAVAVEVAISTSAKTASAGDWHSCAR